jgi:hypothetical protein
MELHDEASAGWMIFNSTDSVYFDPRTFGTKEDAAAAAEDHRAAYATQGYYLTADGFRIDPAEIEIEIVPA